MPIPPIIIPPHLLLSIPTAGPGGIATGSRAAASGVYYGGSTLLASVLAANLWKNTPEWIKEDASWQSFATKRADVDAGEGDNASFVDEMATLSSVISKLELLVTEGYERLGSQRRMKRRRNIVKRSVSSGKSTYVTQTDDQGADEQIISPLEWHAALLAYWQLCNQIRERYPEWRNDVYKIADSNNSNLSAKQIDANERDMPINITTSQIKELQTMLDYAVWAYEPNEEKLRSYLLSGRNNGKGKEALDKDDESKERGGYQLIVHRTTSYIDPNESILPDTSSSKDNTTNSKKQSKNKVKRKPPGRVGYFVAISHEQQTVLIGIKGTSTLEELLTDCCGRAVRVDLDNDPHSFHQPSTGSSGDRTEVELEVDEMIALDNSEEASTIDENDTQLADNKEDEDIYSVEELVLDMIHVPTTKDGCPSESVEVELMNDINQQSSIDTSFESSSPSTDDSKKQDRTAAIPTKPSENVLLFPSHSRAANHSQKTKLNQSQLELHQSPTDEFIETHGIEMEENRSHKLRGAHEGILHCSKQLLFEITPLIEEYSAKGYKFICTGHSLGAGTAILLAVLIRGRYPILTKPMSSSDSSGDSITSERVQTYAFAPPPTLDRSSSLACSHYVTSIVFNSDIIPRSSLTNLDIFLTMLEAVRGRLEEVGMNPGSSKPKTNVVASTVALFRKLSEGIDGELLIEPVELQRLWKDAVGDASIGDGEEDTCYWDAEFGHHLFVPGKLLMMYEDDWSSPQLGSAQQQQVVVSTEEEDSKEDPDHQQSKSIASFNAMWTNGTTISALKRFDIGSGSGMATDHLTTSYERALALLLEHSDKYRLT